MTGRHAHGTQANWAGINTGLSMAFVVVFVTLSLPPSSPAAEPTLLSMARTEDNLARMALPYLLRLLPALCLGLCATGLSYRHFNAVARREPSLQQASSTSTADNAVSADEQAASDASERRGDGAAILALLKFQQAVLHDFINRLRNRFPDEPERFVSRLAGEQMRSDLQDYLDRRIPSHRAAMDNAPACHGLAQLFAQWPERLRPVEDFLRWAPRAAESSNEEGPSPADWVTRLGQTQAYCEELQDAILAAVAEITIDLADLLEEVAALFPEVQLSAGLGLTIRHGGGRELHDSLKAVFTNLCDNALNAGARQIAIAAQRRGDDAIQVTVKDNGAGLPTTKSHDELFLTGVGEGSGTGLAKVRRLLSRWGGRVEIGESQGADGATFIVSLPREVTN